MTTGLVLEGGAMRGMYTAGVLDIFMDNNIPFDMIVGVSAGALFGVNYLSKQRGRAIRYNKRFNSNKEYMGLWPLLKEGNIVSTKFAYEKVPQRLDPFDAFTFNRNPTPFYAVVCNIETGEPEYIEIRDVFEQMDTLRASGSMPFVSKPVEINGKYYLDGGISDSIPFKWAEEHGCDKRVVILTRDMDYRKRPMASFIVKYYRKYPNVRDRLMKRHENYNMKVEQLKKLEAEGKVFVIRPTEPIKIGRMEKDPDKMQEVYELGLSDGQKYLEAMKAYMGI